MEKGVFSNCRFLDKHRFWYSPAMTLLVKDTVIKASLSFNVNGRGRSLLAAEEAELVDQKETETAARFAARDVGHLEVGSPDEEENILLEEDLADEPSLDTDMSVDDEHEIDADVGQSFSQVDAKEDKEDADEDADEDV